MRKFKLIKELPFENSPKLGYISTTIRTDGVHYWNNNWYNPENYPEFWQLVIEKDYEILKFILPGNNIIHIQNAKNSLEFMLKNSNTYKIYSVKRLSDGEVFTVGDNTNHGKILNIYFGENITFHCDKDDEDPWLEDLKHIKQPLFTTEDGVDIFEGDVVTVVSLKDFKEGDCDGENDTPIEAYSITWKNKIISSYNWNLRKDNFLQFSTKEKAEEYILMNKPCLSINNFLKVFPKYISMSERDSIKLKELVQQKLNK